MVTLRRHLLDAKLATIRASLVKQSIYWYGVSWVALALEQRVSGDSDAGVDLQVATEPLASTLSVPDRRWLSPCAE